MLKNIFILNSASFELIFGLAKTKHINEVVLFHLDTNFLQVVTAGSGSKPPGPPPDTHTHIYAHKHPVL